MGKEAAHAAVAAADSRSQGAQSAPGAKVTAFPEKESTAEKPGQTIAPTPAIGASIAINIGGDRQLTLQGFFERDADDAECNRVLDKMRHLATRQKAFADVDRLNDELADHYKALNRFAEDLTRTENEHQEAQQKRRDQITELQQRADKVFNDAYERHSAGGKRGGFELRGADKANKDRIAPEMAKIDGDIAKAENERAQFIEQLHKNMERYREEIALREKRIAEAKALIGG